MSQDKGQLSLVQEASTDDAALIGRILADGGVQTALWGVIAATHYGGGLCPMVCFPSRLNARSTDATTGYRADRQ